MKVDKDAEGARPLPPSSVLTSCNDERCHSGGVPGALAARKPTRSFHVTRRRMATKNGMTCGGMCVKLYASNGRKILLFVCIM
jgi:hypothetical protein